jgi:hypothetical protein
MPPFFLHAANDPTFGQLAWRLLHFCSGKVIGTTRPPSGGGSAGTGTEVRAVATKKQQAQNDNPAKEPEEWVTGEEPMTGPQRSYLKTLAREAGEPVDEDMTKAESSRKIEELQEKTGRGTPQKKRAAPRKKGSTRRR